MLSNFFSGNCKNLPDLVIVSGMFKSYSNQSHRLFTVSTFASDIRRYLYHRTGQLGFMIRETKVTNNGEDYKEYK